MQKNADYGTWLLVLLFTALKVSALNNEFTLGDVKWA
jgi:hypothetical protein